MKALELFDLLEAGTPIVEIIEKLAEEQEAEVEHNSERAQIYPPTSRRRKEYSLAGIKALERAETFRFVVSIMRLDRLAIRNKEKVEPDNIGEIHGRQSPSYDDIPNGV